MFDNFFPTLGKVLSAEWLVILEGLGNTLLIAIAAMIIGTIIGTLIASIKLIPRKKSNWLLKIVNWICEIYLGFFRGTPVVVQLLLIYFVIFAAGAPALLVAIIVFGLNSGAYVSEIMRGGILAVDKGQMEASRCLGFNYSQSMQFTILPQAMKNAIPNLGNEFITLFKETSVAGFITVIDLTKTMQLIVASSFNVAVPYILLAIIYLVMVMLFTFLLRLIERRLRRSDTRK